MDAITRKKPVVKLVHPGGLTETHKKPITAAEVMKKNPRHFVTRPDVFKFPWIVVQPESFLQPGDVFYIVPFHTIRGLLRRKAFPCELLNRRESPDSCGSEDKESERASELFRLGSCPYDSSSERTKIVKRRSPNACQKTERCWLGECYAGNLTSSKKHCLDQLGEILQQQRQQGLVSPSNERNKAGSRHKSCKQFLEKSCTYDASNEVTPTHHLLKRRSPGARQNTPSYKPEGYVKGNRRSVHPVGHHHSLLLSQTKQHLDLFVGKNSPDSTSFHTRVTLENKLSPAKLSRPKYAGGDYYPVIKRPSSHPCLNMKSPKLGEPDSGISGCQSEGTPSKEQYLEKPRKSSDSFTFWLHSEADGPAGDSEGWQESSPEEGGFHWPVKCQSPGSCGDAESPHYGDQQIGNELYFDMHIDGKVSIGSGDCQNMQGRYDGAQNDVFKLKSCLKKNKNKLSGRRVRFTLPGEDDNNLRVEVFEFRDEETL